MNSFVQTKMFFH